LSVVQVHDRHHGRLLWLGHYIVGFIPVTLSM